MDLTTAVNGLDTLATIFLLVFLLSLLAGSARRRVLSLVRRIPRPQPRRAGTVTVLSTRVIPAPRAPMGGSTDIMRALTTDVVHLMLVGGTGAGKTTVTRALAHTLVERGDVVMVGDPKVLGPDSNKWPGCEVWGDLDEFAMELSLVKAELDTRVEAAKQGYGNFPHWWVIMDEYWRIWPTNAEVRSAVEGILRLAREYNIHLVLGSQDNQAASMGLEGRTKLMSNFTWIVELQVNAESGARSAAFCRYVNGSNRPSFWREVPPLPSWQPNVKDYAAYSPADNSLVNLESAPPSVGVFIRDCLRDGWKPSRIVRHLKMRRADAFALISSIQQEAPLQ